MNTAGTTIDVAVRDVSGGAWSERWPLDKLAYLILCSDLTAPKFEQAMAADWVPFDRNEYRWDKAQLTHATFSDIASKWPGGLPQPFQHELCERIQVVFEWKIRLASFTVVPTTQLHLFQTLLGLDDPGYECFDYSSGNHVFFQNYPGASLWHRLAPSAKALQDLSNRYKELCKFLSIPPGSIGYDSIRLTYVCPDRAFHPPFTFWIEL